MKKILYIAFCLMMAVGCGNNPGVPENYSEAGRKPVIFPEYTDVTIPSNIAPLNFAVREPGVRCVARLTCGQLCRTYGDGMKVRIDMDEWRQLLSEAKGGKIDVEVFVENGGKWTAYQSFCLFVADEPIDEYISYRLIKPSYVAYELLTINQRNLTNFEEKDIYNNMMVSSEAKGQCVNCHSYRNFRTDDMQLHLRQGFGGTIIVKDNHISKVDLKTDSTISAGVYPAWHPTEDIIAYSTNSTGQSFHTKDKAKIEVQDTRSDLILYDIDKNEVTNISCLEDEFEVFPTWDADGKTLYFCSAHFEYLDTVAHETELIKRYKEVHYNLYKKSFDPKTRTFGPTRLVYDAESKGRSVTLPRVSPDNRYILFAEGEFGCFHVWHPDADICIIDLKSGAMRKVENVNSDCSESYPTWSSNGRWMMMASRRDDGNFTRPYIAYFDKSGKAHKAFELPQEDPNFYTFCGKSYNRPEFMVEPVHVSPHELAEVGKQEAVKASFRSNGVYSGAIDATTSASARRKTAAQTPESEGNDTTASE